MTDARPAVHAGQRPVIGEQQVGPRLGERPTVTDPTLCPECMRLQALCSHFTGHAHQLRYLLGEVRPTLADLEESFARQARIGERVGAKSGEQALPFDERASEASDLLLAGTVAKWAERIWRCNPATERPADPVAYLLEHLGRLRRRPWSIQLFVDVHKALEHAWRTVDIAEEYLEAGACDCGKRLMARPGASMVICRACSRQYDVAVRRAQMLEYAESMWYPASDIERMVNIFVRMGERDRIVREVDAALVRKWGERGELAQMQIGGHVSYRLRDVLDRALRAPERQSAKSPKVSAGKSGEVNAA